MKEKLNVEGTWHFLDRYSRISIYPREVTNDSEKIITSMSKLSNDMVCRSIDEGLFAKTWTAYKQLQNGGEESLSLVPINYFFLSSMMERTLRRR